MPFIPVPNVVQARLDWAHDNGLVAENVFYHATTGVPTMSDLNDIGDLWGSLFAEALVTNTSPEWNLLSVTLRAMNEAEGIEINYSDGFPFAGTNPSSAAPNNCSYTVTWGTGLVGRSARGRTYVIGMPINSIAQGNRLVDASQAAFQNSWDIVREGFATGGHAIQVVSFIEGGVPRAEGRALPALACAVRFPLATRRSRLT
jgi:hypothetical protein